MGFNSICTAKFSSIEVYISLYLFLLSEVLTHLQKIIVQVSFGTGLIFWTFNKPEDSVIKIDEVFKTDLVLSPKSFDRYTQLASY